MFDGRVLGVGQWCMVEEIAGGIEVVAEMVSAEVWCVLVFKTVFIWIFNMGKEERIYKLKFTVLGLKQMLWLLYLWEKEERIYRLKQNYGYYTDMVYY